LNDHWHAPYRVVVCGEQQPPIEEFTHTSGIHTHTDGIMHLHPLTSEGEGSGASVESFFNKAGGWFDVLRVRDGCVTQDPRVLRADSGIHPLGSGFAEASVICDELSTVAFEEVGLDYIPQDGDCLRIIFGETES
jgi:hypothetical protein